MPPPRRKVDLKKTLFLLPNIITLSSIFCGFDSIRMSASAVPGEGTGDDDFYRASLLIIFALFFDMLDGRVARLTNTFQPRLHDFRHTFAVVRLVTWYREGKNVQRLLPHLSIYLGHGVLRDTQRYLSMTTELLQQASLCFERYARPEVPHV